MLRQARTRVIGHLSYYAITDNSEKCSTYMYHAKRALFKWLNRKSQRRSYTWKGFSQALDSIGWPKLGIRKDLNPYRRAEAIWRINRRAVCMGKPLVWFWEGPGCNGWPEIRWPGHVVVASDEALMKVQGMPFVSMSSEVPGLLDPFSTKNLSGCQIVADSQETCQMRGVKGERRYFAVYPGQENVPV